MKPGSTYQSLVSQPDSSSEMEPLSLSFASRASSSPIEGIFSLPGFRYRLLPYDLLAYHLLKPGARLLTTPPTVKWPCGSIVGVGGTSGCLFLAEIALDEVNSFTLKHSSGSMVNC